jgi:hypothetical protein
MAGNSEGSDGKGELHRAKEEAAALRRRLGNLRVVLIGIVESGKCGPCRLVKDALAADDEARFQAELRGR